MLRRRMQIVGEYAVMLLNRFVERSLRIAVEGRPQTEDSHFGPRWGR